MQLTGTLLPTCCLIGLIFHTNITILVIVIPIKYKNSKQTKSPFSILVPTTTAATTTTTTTATVAPIVEPPAVVTSKLQHSYQSQHCIS